MRYVSGFFATGLMLLVVLFVGCGGGMTPFEDTSNYSGLILDGWTAYNNNEFAEAQSLFSGAMKVDPDRAEGYIGDGWSLFMRQKPDSALVIFYKGFEYARTGQDSLDTICGVSGCYLARGENTRVISYLDRFDLDRFENEFPLENHDFFLDRGDLELTYALAFYRLKIYSSAEGPDPNNAVFHMNRALPAPFTYTDPRDLMERMTEYFNQSQGIPF
jgi:hypothetical protein